MRYLPIFPLHPVFRVLPIFFALAGASMSASGAPAIGAPKLGGVLTVALQRQADCLDPQQSNYGYGTFDGRQIVDSLTDQGLHSPDRLSPWLAKFWQVSKDARVFTFNLREDVTFSDGTPLTADVVKRNFDILARLPGAAGAGYLKDIASIETLGKYVVRVSFHVPNMSFLQATSTAELGILAPVSLDKTADRRCAEGVVGSGPFVLDKVVFNAQTSLVKRKGYHWASPLRAHQGEAYLDKIVYRIVPEASARSGALRSGQVDVIQAVSFNDVKELEQAGYRVSKIPFFGLTSILVINTKNAILRELPVRQALQLAINRRDVSDLAFSGYYTPATGVLSPNSPGYVDQSAALKSDPELAGRILDAAGWKKSGDGIRIKDGKRLSLSVSYYAGPANQAFLEVVQQQLRDIGVDLKLKPLVGGAFDKALLMGDYDMHRWGWSLADPDVVRSFFSSKTLNRFQLEPGNAIDEKLDEQRATSDPAKRARLVAEVQSIIVREAYGLPILNSTALWASNKVVKGETFGPGGSGGPNQIAYDTWLDR